MKGDGHVPSKKEENKSMDTFFVSKAMEEKLDEAIEEMHRGEMRSLDIFMKELREKYSYHE